MQIILNAPGIHQKTKEGAEKELEAFLPRLKQILFRFRPVLLQILHVLLSVFPDFLTINANQAACSAVCVIGEFFPVHEMQRTLCSTPYACVISRRKDSGISSGKSVNRYPISRCEFLQAGLISENAHGKRNGGATRITCKGLI